MIKITNSLQRKLATRIALTIKICWTWDNLEITEIDSM